MFRNQDDGQRPVDWGGATIVFGVVLALAVLAMIMVVTADFGDGTPTTVPRTPGACAPFCPTPLPPP